MKMMIKFEEYMRKTRKGTVEERFWSKVVITANINKCWLWEGYISTNGYGRFNVDGKMQAAHRIAYELTKDKIPENLIVMHSCDNRACVNPHHLSIGTYKDNSQDMLWKGRHGIEGKTGKDNPLSKIVYGVNLESGIELIFYSLSEVANELNTSKGIVADVISGRRRHTRGWYFYR